MGYLGFMWIFGYTWENKCKQPVQVGQVQGIGAFPEQSEIKQFIILVGNLLMNIYFNFCKYSLHESKQRWTIKVSRRRLKKTSNFTCADMVTELVLVYVYSVLKHTQQIETEYHLCSNANEQN